MVTRILLVAGLMLQAAPANAQLSPTTFAGIPLWADSALRRAGLGQQLMLSSTLNPVYALGDFDRDGLVDVAVEVKDTGGLRCGIAITRAMDRSVWILGAGRPLGNGANQIACGRWRVEVARHGRRQGGFSPDLVYALDAEGHGGWLVWDGTSYRWVQAEGSGA